MKQIGFSYLGIWPGQAGLFWYQAQNLKLYEVLGDLEDDLSDKKQWQYVGGRLKRDEEGNPIHSPEWIKRRNLVFHWLFLDKQSEPNIQQIWKSTQDQLVERAFKVACMFGYMVSVRWLFETIIKGWNDNAVLVSGFFLAMGEKHLPVVNYLIMNGNIDSVANRGSISELVKWTAIREDSLEIFKKYRPQDSYQFNKIFSEAIENGSMDIVKYLTLVYASVITPQTMDAYRNKKIFKVWIPVSYSTFEYMINRDHLPMLEYLLENGLELSPREKWAIIVYSSTRIFRRFIEQLKDEEHIDKSLVRRLSNKLSSEDVVHVLSYMKKYPFLPDVFDALLTHPNLVDWLKQYPERFKVTQESLQQLVREHKRDLLWHVLNYAIIEVENPSRILQQIFYLDDPKEAYDILTLLQTNSQFENVSVFETESYSVWRTIFARDIENEEWRRVILQSPLPTHVDGIVYLGIVDRFDENVEKKRYWLLSVFLELLIHNATLAVDLMNRLEGFNEYELFIPELTEIWSKLFKTKPELNWLDIFKTLLSRGGVVGVGIVKKLKISPKLIPKTIVLVPGERGWWNSNMFKDLKQMNIAIDSEKTLAAIKDEPYYIKTILNRAPELFTKEQWQELEAEAKASGYDVTKEMIEEYIRKTYQRYPRRGEPPTKMVKDRLDLDHYYYN